MSSANHSEARQVEDASERPINLLRPAKSTASSLQSEFPCSSHEAGTDLHFDHNWGPTDNKTALCLLFVDQFRELFEKIVRVVRSWRCLRMILHTKDWQLFVPHSFDRPIVQVDVGYFDFFRQ